MDTITCIKTRRSVRKFKQEPISKDIIEDLVWMLRMRLLGRILRQHDILQ